MKPKVFGTDATPKLNVWHQDCGDVFKMVFAIQEKNKNGEK